MSKFEQSYKTAFEKMEQFEKIMDKLGITGFVGSLQDSSDPPGATMTFQCQKYGYSLLYGCEEFSSDGKESTMKAFVSFLFAGSLSRKPCFVSVAFHPEGIINDENIPEWIIRIANPDGTLENFSSSESQQFMREYLGIDDDCHVLTETLAWKIIEDMVQSYSTVTEVRS